jgi:threonine dehydrogenase-like Zn-dependent dehydrogenase
MRALVFRGAWDIGVETRPDPRPGPDDVLIRITATGICGSDIHGFTGENGRRHPGQIMGHETVGRVVSGSDAFPAGTLVTVNPVIACGTCPACRAGAEQSCPHRRVIGVTKEIESAFADLLVVPARNVVALPESMPEEYGALVEPLAVGYHAALRGGCTADDRVLVIGGGPIGQACVLAARRLGVQRVVVSEPNRLRRELVAALGASAADPTAGDVARSVEDALGGPATLVLDAVGSSRSLADAAACSSFGARIVLVGMNAPRIELSAYTISTEERSLVGSFCYSARHFRETAEWVGGAPDELRHLVDDHVGLDAAAGAFTALAKGESQASKVLVYPGGVPAADTTTQEVVR